MEDSEDNWTALHEAAALGDAALISNLLDKDSSLATARDSVSSAPRPVQFECYWVQTGGTALHAAAYNGRFYAARRLLDLAPILLHATDEVNGHHQCPSATRMPSQSVPELNSA